MGGSLVLFPWLDSIICITFFDPASNVASFGLLGLLLGMVQSVVLGVDIVENNVVFRYAPYFVGTGTEELTQM